MTELEEKLGYSFKNKSLLTSALTHSSYANEKRDGSVCNERLEFLGDAVLGLVVARHLYTVCPNMPEGRMTKLRSELVCERSLDAVAAKLSLGDYLLLGKGEEQCGGRTRPSIIADAVEAVLAAVYLDGGMEAAEKIIMEFILNDCELGDGAITDSKTRLQEIIQRKGGQTLSYRVTGESGPDHLKQFDVEVLLNGRVIGTGTGRSKKDAEQAAAKKAIAELYSGK